MNTVTPLVVIKTFITYVLSGLILFLIGPIILLFLYIPARWRRDNKILFFLLNVLYHAPLVFSFIKITTNGGYDKKKPTIFAPNHQSSLDVPLMGSIVGFRPHIWFVLSYYVKFPVLGTFVKALCIPVEQETGGTRALLKGIKLIQGTKRHVIIFPEGRRWTDGYVHEFKPGVALLARHTKRPVVPVYMKDPYKIYPPGSFWVYSDNPLSLTIGPEFFIDDHESDKEFTQRIRGWFVAQQQ